MIDEYHFYGSAEEAKASLELNLQPNGNYAYVFEYEGNIYAYWHYEDRYLFSVLPGSAKVLWCGKKRLNLYTGKKYLTWEERAKENIMDVDIITAQSLYDWQQATGAVSGTELHLFFAAVCGYLTPSGNDKISIEQIKDVAKGSYVRAEELQHIANSCETLEPETARIVLESLCLK